MIDPIVSFQNPPVVEVSAGISFPDLGPTGVALAATFWRDEAKTEFPSLQVQPPYEPVIEQFVGGQPAFPQIKMLAGYPLPRMWAVGDDGQHLLQLQSAWFACNWRRVRPSDTYPRWASRRTEFDQWFRRFSAYAADAGVSLQTATQAEVTYINHITPNDVFKSHRDFDRVFTVGFTNQPAPAEQLTFDIKLIIEDEEGRPIGRLHANAAPAFNAASDPIYVFQLTARGRPQGGDVIGFLDRGRELIDRTFVSLTTEGMQEEWGRTL